MTFSIFRAVSTWRHPLPKMDKHKTSSPRSPSPTAAQIESPSVLESALV